MPPGWNGTVVPLERNSDPMVLIEGVQPFKPKRAGGRQYKNMPNKDFMCEKCKHNARCRERARLGLWVMCEIPDELDLMIAKRMQRRY